MGIILKGWLLNMKKKEEKYVFIFLLFLSIIRLYIGIKTPLFIQADAIYDDQVLVKYAVNILNGNWLGAYDAFSLVKASSFSFILAFMYILGIPYSFGLTALYIFACFLLSKAINKGVNNNILFSCLYAFLLYSPVMFNEDMQNVYRDGFLVAFSMMVIASVVGIFFSIYRNDRRAFLKWLILEIITLPIFWLMKEDSVWILPLVVIGNLLSIIDYIYQNREATPKALTIAKQIGYHLVPFIVLIIAICSYKAVNASKYGEYTITDRTGTYFKEVIADLIKIEDPTIGTPHKDDVWVTREMLKKASECSPTLATYMPEIEKEYDVWASFTTENNEGVAGDLFIWVVRNGFSNMGLYEQGPESVHKCYEQIHKELSEAFDNGTLAKDNERIFLSSVVRGMTFKEMGEYYSSRTPEVVKSIISYDSPEVTKSPATGNYDDVVVFANLINSDFIWNNTGNRLSDWQYRYVDIDNKIIRKAYQILSIPISILTLIGLILMVIQSIHELKKHSKLEVGRVTIILIGLILTAVLVIFAVMWFCSYCSMREIVNYTASLIPMIQVCEIVSIYYLVSTVVRKRLIHK